MKLREDSQPMTEVGIRMMNLIGTGVIQIARFVLFISRPLTWFLDRSLDFFEWVTGLDMGMDGNQQLQGDMRKFFREISRGNFGNPINQRPGRDRRLP